MRFVYVILVICLCVNQKLFRHHKPPSKFSISVLKRHVIIKVNPRAMPPSPPSPSSPVDGGSPIYRKAGSRSRSKSPRPPNSPRPKLTRNEQLTHAQREQKFRVLCQGIRDSRFGLERETREHAVKNNDLEDFQTESKIFNEQVAEMDAMVKEGGVVQKFLDDLNKDLANIDRLTRDLEHTSLIRVTAKPDPFNWTAPQTYHTHVEKDANGKPIVPPINMQLRAQTREQQNQLKADHQQNLAQGQKLPRRHGKPPPPVSQHESQHSNYQPPQYHQQPDREQREKQQQQEREREHQHQHLQQEYHQRPQRDFEFDLSTAEGRIAARAAKGSRERVGGDLANSQSDKRFAHSSASDKVYERLVSPDRRRKSPLSVGMSKMSSSLNKSSSSASANFRPPSAGSKAAAKRRGNDRDKRFESGLPQGGLARNSYAGDC